MCNGNTTIVDTTHFSLKHILQCIFLWLLKGLPVITIQTKLIFCQLFVGLYGFNNFYCFFNLNFTAEVTSVYLGVG